MKLPKKYNWLPITSPPKDGEFYVLDENGNVVLRDLANEDIDFSIERYHKGMFDSYNMLYHENFTYFQFESKGSDYERHGCQIKEGMKVLDLGANIGAFARYARFKGASKVYCFEPMSPTYHCLQLNTAGCQVIDTFNLGIGVNSGKAEFHIHTNFTHNGGGSMMDFQGKTVEVLHSESCAIISVEEVFKHENWGDIDFLKIDIEGAEESVLEALPDAALQRLVCISGEFHCHDEKFEIFQRNFIQRCRNFGFESFVLFHGNGKLRTVTLWKN
jgi:hypothetical protein